MYVSNHTYSPTPIVLKCSIQIYWVPTYLSNLVSSYQIRDYIAVKSKT